MRYDLTKILLLSAILSTASPAALAGANDFFGNQLPGSVGSVPDRDEFAQDSTKKGKSSDSSAATPAAGPNDFSDDEKRMQRKYKSNLAHLKDLVAKGQSMMDKAPNHDDKDYKKGKILKEIGEKRLAEMEANNPLPESVKAKDKKKDKKAPDSL